MAAQPFSTTRRTLLGAAAALPLAFLPTPNNSNASRRDGQQLQPSEGKPGVSAAVWNRRLTLYRRLHARWRAEAETGAYRAANDEYEEVRQQLIARFGSWQKACRSRLGKPLCATAFAHVTSAENAYYQDFTAPMQRAIERLLSTPVPDLRGLLAKLETLLEHELESFESDVPQPWKALISDVRRLAELARASEEANLILV
jgi:hypothetical protein